MPKFKDLKGHKFDHWTVLEQVLPKTSVMTKWRCQCKCGAVKEIQSGHLTSGASKSCGCKERPAIKHGEARAGKRFKKKYSTWRYIRQRCLDPNGKDAHLYYGLLCERWNEYGFFDLDVPDPPSEEFDGQWSIDRIENSKGYEPGNVRWVTMADQHRNQTNCRYIEFNGKTQILADWARELGVKYETLYRRIEAYGVEIALSMPPPSSKNG